FDGHSRGGTGTWTSSGVGNWSAVDDGGDVRFRFDGASSPPGSDASLISPEVDLSSAASATVTLRTNFSLETGYDAGRLEISPDGGATWYPLSPRASSFLPAGYPAGLAAGSPLLPSHDPTSAERAFTGASADVSDAAREAG